jgi:hypothetical protein
MFRHNNPYLAHITAIDVDIHIEACREVEAEMKEEKQQIWATQRNGKTAQTR